MSSGSELSFSFFGDCKATSPDAWPRGIRLPGLGPIGRIVVAVRLQNGMQSVSRCPARDLLAGLEQLPSLLSQRQRPVLQSLVRFLMIDVPVAELLGLCVSMQYLLQAMLLETESLRTSDLVPLRRVCLGGDQVSYLPRRILSNLDPSMDLDLLNSLQAGTIHFP